MRPTKSRKRFATGSLLALLVALAAATLAVQVGSASGDGAEGESSGPGTKVELPAKRTATSDTFELEDGELECQYFLKLVLQCLLRLRFYLQG